MPVKIERSSYSDRQAVERDMDALYLGNLNTVEFDLQLPTKGRYGSDIRWESGHDRFLANDGRVSRPLHGTGNREVVLTGFFSCGKAQGSKEYLVTILEQEKPCKTVEAYPVFVKQYTRAADEAGKVEECAKAKVRILPGNEFYEAEERMHQYLLHVEDDRMLYHFRKASGLDTLGADSPDGWDAEECKLRGHTTGHYLSALALCYHAVGDVRIRDKAVYMVQELGKCQQAFAQIDGVKEGFLGSYLEEQFDLLERYTPYPKIWAPYYTLHKVLAGLLDCFQYIESREALTIAERIGMWTYRRLSRLPKQQLEKMWSMYIAGEFGGMNAVMAQLAGLTGRKEFIQCARFFDNAKLFEPLSRGKDMLEGMHANQHIPQILGAVELYKITGERRYLDIAEVFWTTVTENRSYACGGVGEGEMFHGFREIGGLLTANTQETCASYNMLKLTKELYQFHPDTAYMDYYERVLFNHILATPAKDESGESTYFFPLGPGMRRTFLKENNCCHGTGMENHFKYREGIYYRKKDDIYINLYIPSELWFDNRDGVIRIERLSQSRQSYRIRIRGRDIRTLYLRKPGWAEIFELRENNKRLELMPDQNGYLVISGDFLTERELEVEWGQCIQLIRTPDEPELAALQYGPYILAVLSENQDFLFMPFDETSVGRMMEKDSKDVVHFCCGNWRWIPLYEINREAYHVYVKCKL